MSRAEIFGERGAYRTCASDDHDPAAAADCNVSTASLFLLPDFHVLTRLKAIINSWRAPLSGLSGCYAASVICSRAGMSVRSSEPSCQYRSTACLCSKGETKSKVTRSPKFGGGRWQVSRVKLHQWGSLTELNRYCSMPIRAHRVRRVKVT